MADEEKNEDLSVPLVTHVNKIRPSIFSNVEVYINNQYFYKSNVCAQVFRFLQMKGSRL